MKSKTLTLFLILFFAVVTANGQDKAKKTGSSGTWKFDAPYAPYGYNTGIITVGFENQKSTASMLFTGSDYKIPGENVRATTDSLVFTVYVEDQDVKVLLKIEDESRMSGKAIYSEGEVPLTLTKSTEPDTL
jgi:hypothetical protein